MKIYTENRLNIFKALSDKTRLIILDIVANKEICACDIGEELNLAQSKVAYHMKLLCECGLVVYETKGKYTFYSMTQSTKEKLDSFLQSLENESHPTHTVTFCTK